MELVAIMKRLRVALDPERATLMLLVAMAGLCSGCPAISSAPEAPPDTVCEHHLVRLGETIAAYRREKGSLPQIMTGAAGFKCSWRVRIAPYLMDGDSQSFDYRLEESWDTAYNRQQLLNWIPCKFTCPLESNRTDYPFTSYTMLLRADSTGSNGEGCEVMPLPDDAVLIVESVGCRIEYGEPRDIDIETLFRGDSPFGVGKLNSLHPKVVKALRVDGKVIDIPKDIAKKALQKLLAGTTTNGTR